MDIDWKETKFLSRRRRFSSEDDDLYSVVDRIRIVIQLLVCSSTSQIRKKKIVNVYFPSPP